MLSQLHIENIAVIELVDLEPGGAFNVLTGETGAGKSIIIDAISAITGERMSRDLIRSGEQQALVSAIFSDLSNSPRIWLEDNGYTTDENGDLLISRQLSADGRNTCRINGKPVTVALLKQLGNLLISIHGQHDNQNLLNDSNHLTYLDSFASNSALLDKYINSYDNLLAIKREIEKLTLNEDEKIRRIDNLKFRIEEIELANLSESEEEALLARRDILRNSERINEAIENCFSSLFGDDDSAGAASLIDYASESISGASPYDARLESLYRRLNDLKFSTEDLIDDLRDLRGDYLYSPEEMDYTEDRLDTINRLKKKYGPTVEDILTNLQKYKSELEDYEFSSEAIEKLQIKLTGAEEDNRKLARELTKSRTSAGDLLAKSIQAELTQLDMPKVRFLAEIDRLAQPGPLGADSVSFLISANVGEEPKPISRIASGGELSRIMLAMKNVLAKNDDVQTLIFDEVDAGVSGRAAQRVAEKLCQVSAYKQVLCVTHLPQIAAMADSHFLIEKREEDGRTFTSVDLLRDEVRKAEVARIISGAKVTETTIKNAEEMIESANLFRRDIVN